VAMRLRMCESGVHFTSPDRKSLVLLAEAVNLSATPGKKTCKCYLRVQNELYCRSFALYNRSL
jgi:hypothetical protein